MTSFIACISTNMEQGKVFTIKLNLMSCSQQYGFYVKH